MESIRQIKNNNVDLISNNDPLDKNRLLIEDLWESVLREECPNDQAERLIQLKELLDKKARKSGYKKITPEDITSIGFTSIDDLAVSLAEGKTSLSKLKPLKPWFALNPPVHGFKRSTKRLYGQKGVLGHNKELLVIVKRMM